MLLFIRIITSIALLPGIVYGHAFLNLTLAGSRTCPYINTFNYRISTFLNAIEDLTSGIMIYSPFDFEGMDQQHLYLSALNESFAYNDFASISFPKKVHPKTTYFSHQQLFYQGGVDTSDQSLWYSMDAVLNGGSSFISTPYGVENEASLYDFFMNLDFDLISINAGVGSYVCDDDNSWGMTKAMVTLRKDDTMYVGKAQLITTHMNIDSNDYNGWYMTSMVVYWDIGHNEEDSNNEAIFYIIIGCLVFLLLVIIGLFVCYMRKFKRHFELINNAGNNPELSLVKKNIEYETFQDTNQ
eukprot:444069_1